MHGSGVDALSDGLTSLVSLLLPAPPSYCGRKFGSGNRQRVFEESVHFQKGHESGAIQPAFMHEKALRLTCAAGVGSWLAVKI